MVAVLNASPTFVVQFTSFLIDAKKNIPQMWQFLITKLWSFCSCGECQLKASIAFPHSHPKAINQTIRAELACPTRSASGGSTTLF
jgi:hypothetical protein